MLRTHYTAIIIFIFLAGYVCTLTLGGFGNTYKKKKNIRGESVEFFPFFPLVGNKSAPPPTHVAQLSEFKTLEIFGPMGFASLSLSFSFLQHYIIFSVCLLLLLIYLT